MKKIALVLVLILGLCGSLYAQEKVSSDIQILFLKQRIQILEQQLRIKDLEQEAMKKTPLESDMDAAAEVGASANSYTENFTPSLTADYLLGIDNFGEGGWAVNRFDLVNLQELFQQAPSTIGSGTPNTGAFTTLTATSFGCPNSAADVALADAGKMHLNTTDEQLSFHSAADGEISGEASISLINHIAITVDPTGYYNQESTYRTLPIMTIGDDAPEGIQITEWRVNYVGGDPTTELDADLMCDTTPDFNPADNATVMDILDTTAGASTADTGFDSTNCANGSKLYIRFGADPTDANVVILVDVWYYNEED